MKHDMIKHILAGGFGILAEGCAACEVVCTECGHIHTAVGCTGDPTPSDLWAGVMPAACDCVGVS